MNKMEKRGELTSKQLITIIILIISFAIIIAFFIMLGIGSSIDKESCRNSVVMRGALPAGKDIISLKCKTQDVCLSMGGDCGVTREDLVTVKVDGENELVEEMVNLLWDCWWMMGEGKVDYMSIGLGFNEAYCSFCSKVYFDSKIQENYPDGISYKKLYDYMEKNKVPNKDETYMYNFYKLNSMDKVREELLKGEWKVDIYDYKLDPMKEQAVITAIVKQGWGGKALSAASGILPGIGLGLLILNIPGAVAGGFIGFSIGLEEIDAEFYIPRYLEFDGKELEALDCKEYVSEG